MLRRRTMRGPLIGAFQMPVWTVLPCQVTSRGRPTLTESKRPIAFPDHDRQPFREIKRRLTEAISSAVKQRPAKLDGNEKYRNYQHNSRKAWPRGSPLLIPIY